MFERYWNVNDILLQGHQCLRPETKHLQKPCHYIRDLTVSTPMLPLFSWAFTQLLYRFFTLKTVLARKTKRHSYYNGSQIAISPRERAKRKAYWRDATLPSKRKDLQLIKEKEPKMATGSISLATKIKSNSYNKTVKSARQLENNLWWCRILRCRHKGHYRVEMF